MQHVQSQSFPQLSAWTAALRQVSTAPLAFCLRFPEIARRFEAWWAHDALDRPIFIARANMRPSRPINRRLDLLAEPAAWLQAKLADLRQQLHVGDALPMVRVDLGPVALGGLIGAPVEFISDSTWTHAFIADDWSNAPDWTIKEQSAFYQHFRTLWDLAATDAAGRYLVCTPSLGASADVLLNLRGSSQLALDVLEQPEKIVSALEAIYHAWQRMYRELYEITRSPGVGLVHWLGLWSDRPYLVAECDFNSMIGPRAFQRLFLPDIAGQVAAVGRAVFHLDGPGAARHIDALLDVPGLEAIQFTPGAGTPSALPWIEMFRKVQALGRSLEIICPADEVLVVCQALRPEGLALWVQTPLSPDGLRALRRLPDAVRY